MLTELFVYFFAHKLNRDKHGEPGCEIYDEKYKGIYNQNLNVKCNPTVYEITKGICKIERAEMKEERFCNGPAFYLIEYAGARMDECEKIGGNYRGEHFESANGKIFDAERQNKIDYCRDDRAKSTENTTSV